VRQGSSGAAEQLRSAVAEWRWPGSYVARVIDGDTLDAKLTRDIGFGGTVTFPVRLRLARINAAKAKSPAGLSATAMTIALTGGAPLEIITLKPYKYGGPADYAGEYMAEVVLPDGRNLSDALVAAGLAVYWDGRGPRPADG
jgi:endonuclease YncB( thermonuclease family)